MDGMSHHLMHSRLHNQAILLKVRSKDSFKDSIFCSKSYIFLSTLLNKKDPLRICEVIPNVYKQSDP